ncbi:hypothetical protein BGW38_007718, partial [Lunasporangiospora selenospora]
MASPGPRADRAARVYESSQNIAYYCRSTRFPGTIEDLDDPEDRPLFVHGRKVLFDTSPTPEEKANDRVLADYFKDLPRRLKDGSEFEPRTVRNGNSTIVAEHGENSGRSITGLSSHPIAENTDIKIFGATRPGESETDEEDDSQYAPPPTDTTLEAERKANSEASGGPVVLFGPQANVNLETFNDAKGPKHKATDEPDDQNPKRRKRQRREIVTDDMKRNIASNTVVSPSGESLSNASSSTIATDETPIRAASLIEDAVSESGEDSTLRETLSSIESQDALIDNCAKETTGFKHAIEEALEGDSTHHRHKKAKTAYKEEEEGTSNDAADEWLEVNVDITNDRDPEADTEDLNTFDGYSLGASEVYVCSGGNPTDVKYRDDSEELDEVNSKNYLDSKTHTSNDYGSYSQHEQGGDPGYDSDEDGLHFTEHGSPSGASGCPHYAKDRHTLKTDTQDHSQTGRQADKQTRAMDIH